MALVDYSDSEPDDGLPITESHGRHDPLITKRKRDSEDLGHAPSHLPPLPSKFHDLYASATRVSTADDPALHGGRLRATPHVEGNWNTHVYLEWYPSRAEHSRITSIMEYLRASVPSEGHKVHSLLVNDLGAQTPLHISLSRPFILKSEQRQPFVERLKHTLTSSVVRPFSISFCSLDWVANFEQTRWFLVLRLATPSPPALNRLLRLSNRTVEAFGQLPLYANPQSTTSASIPAGKGHRGGSKGGQRGGHWRDYSFKTTTSSEKDRDASDKFHVSIGWSLEKPTADLVAIISSQKLFTLMKPVTQEVQVDFQSIKLKMGNAVTNLPFSTQVEESRGLIDS
ncbi:MAG: poly(U)-specific 3'-to-5' RNA exonuclease [Piccolia ochrophora]|nr:MAG: poly(U)-specific 3'-to-5' RNA exonuclease [Piccolia ochrophora]